MSRIILALFLLLSLPSWSLASEATLRPWQSGTVRALTAELSVDSGVVKSELRISVSEIGEDVLPKLDRGLTNVTDSVPGYRFLPHGEHFQGGGAKVVLGYDRTKIPSGYTEDDIRTYYYDEAEGHWIALERDSVDRRNRVVVSHTTHFTDMINGVIQVPESPETQGFAPTMMSELKAADPTAKVQMIEAPQPNSRGSANLSYALEMPPARNGMSPNLTINYSSDAGSGWLGEGWNLSTSAITVDTRWGVPRYDGTETYLLDGEMLVKGREEGTGDEKVTTYHPRREVAFSTILRYGSRQDSYRWEVTDRKGTRYSYGQWKTNQDGKGVRDSVLTGVVRGPYQNDSTREVVSEWRLTRIEEYHGDYVEYKYREEEEHSGGITSTALYLDSVLAGNSGEAAHTTVTFRNSGKTKNISRIDARYGYVVSSNALLDSVSIYHEGRYLRGYVFTYKTGSFQADLLTEVTHIGPDKQGFSRHTLQYHTVVDSLYGTATSDYVSETDIDGFTVINGGATYPDPEKNSPSYSVGGGCNLGVGPVYAGASYTYGETSSRTYVTLTDINGDGLPDRVFKRGDGRLAYEPAIYGGERFGESVELAGAPGDFSDSKSYSHSLSEDVGVGFGGASVGVTFTQTREKNSQRSYISDVNGDGLADIVSDGVVYFNRIGESGHPEFRRTSQGTPNELGRMSAAMISDFEGLSANVDTAALRDSLERMFPLQDAVRMWRAPFSGRVTITGTISASMPESQPEAGNQSRKRDGVRYFIQQEDRLLESGTLSNGASATVSIPATLKAGDRLFFRTNSVDNGEEDIVEWNPVITYADSTFTGADTTDENGLSLKRYAAAEDYAAGVDSSVTIKAKGGIRLLQTPGSGYSKTSRTLSDIRLVVQKRTGEGTAQVEKEIILKKDTVFAEEQFVDYMTETDTSAWTTLLFSVESELPFDDKAVTWSPVVLVEAEQIAGGRDTVITDTLYKSPSRPMYNRQVRTAKTQTVHIDPTQGYRSENGHDGEFRIEIVDRQSVKGRSRTYLLDAETGAYIAVRDGDYLKTADWNGKTVRLLTYADTVLQYAGEELEMLVKMDSVRTDDKGVRDTISVTVRTISSSIRSKTGAEESRYGMMYRGWGQFAYKGDTARADGGAGHQVSELIDTAELDKEQSISQEFQGTVKDMRSETAGGSAFSDEVTRATGTSDVNRFTGMTYQSRQDRYVASTRDVYVSRTGQSSSRQGKSYIDVASEIPSYPSAAEMAEGAYAAPAIRSTSSTKSGTLSGGLKCGFGLSGSYAKLTSNGRTAYMDLNGDGYPDWISESGKRLNIQFTKPDGTQETVGRSADVTLPEQESDAVSGGASVSSASGKANPQPAKMSRWSNSEKNLNNIASDQSASSSPLSVSMSVSHSENKSSATHDWCDVNGDGLPDMVYEDGRVALNLGYSFMSVRPEQGYGSPVTGRSQSDTKGIGVCVPLAGSANISAGVSTTTSASHTGSLYRDINGDGLPDKVELADAGDKTKGYVAYINLGAGRGFDATPYRIPVSSLEKTESASSSLHANFGATFRVWIFSVTPFVNGATSWGSSKTTTSLGDFDGDGFPDLLSSDSEETLKVRYSRIGSANKLKSVTNPFGGSMSIDYAHTQPTYDHPGGKWAMSGLTVKDAVGDSIKTVIAYSGGKRDRKERDFLGFGKVVCSSLADGRVVRETEQTYDVSNYLSAGNLLRTVVKGADSTELYREESISYRHYGVTDGSTLDEKDINAFTRTESAYTVPDSKKVTVYEGTKKGLPLSEETFEYTDSYGNIKTYRFQDLTPGGRSYTTDITYASEKYGTANSVTVKGDDEVTYRHTTAEYTNTFTPWAITRIEQTLNDNQKAKFKLEYDHFGNLTRKESDSTFFIYTYDRRYNMYPERVEDAFGYRSEMEDYDYRYGIPRTVRDMNGYTVKYHVDDYGRIDTIVAPNEQSAGAPYTIFYRYVDGKDYRTRYAVTSHYDVQHPDDPVTTVTHVDGLGRPYQVKKEAEVYDSTKNQSSVVFIVSGKTVYDELGRTVETTHPTTCSLSEAGNIVSFNEEWLNRITYDAVDRPLSQTLPGDESNSQENEASVTTTAYAISDGLLETTITAPNGNVQRAYTNGAGQTVKTVRDLDGKDVEMVFYFDPIGQLDSLMDAKGNITAYTYDKAGRRLSVKHPSTGLTTFKYDVAGNMVERETENLRAEKKKIEYKYEKKRLKQIIYPNHPENNVTYTYGGVNADFNRVGRVALVEDGSGATEFYYGRMGEVVKQRRTLIIPNVAIATYTTQWKYDSQNRLLEMTYPDEESVTYLYNRGGLLNQVYGEKDRKYSYIDDIKYDAYEQKVYQKYGNGTETNYSYSSKRRRLAQLNVSSPHYDGDIMRNAYRYDVMDNIDSLTNDAEFASIANGEKPIGGKVSHRYHYDPWSRLTEAVGTFHSDNKSARYSLKMEYDEVYNVTRKTLNLEQNNLQFKGTLKTGHDFDYKNDSLNTFKLARVDSKEYRSDSTMVDTANVKYDYEFDANGNQVKGGVRQMLWDEENRLLAVSEGGFMSNYFYDCNGERTVKLSSGREEVYVNAQQAYKDDSLPQKFVAYVSPYLVVKNGGQYTKHIYAGNQRIASKLGNIDDFGADPRRVDYAGADLKNIDYEERYKSEVKELETRYDSLGTDCTFRVVNDYVNGKSFCCDNNEVEVFNRPDTENGNSEEAGIFFYHPDHLGSTAMVTDHDGRITQNVVYIPFGEVFVEQRDGNWNTPYLFNAKELDEETGLYYYGARYLDPTGVQWLSVDPLFEKYVGMSPYNYCLNNPVKHIDPNGTFVPNEDGNLVAEQGDNVESLANYLSISVENAIELVKSQGFKKLKKGNVIKLDNAVTRDLKAHKNGRKTDLDIQGYNCFGSTISGILENSIKPAEMYSDNGYFRRVEGTPNNSYMEAAFDFDENLLKNFIQIDSEKAVFMRTAIRFATGYHPADCFERYSSEKPEDIGGAAHGCIYYGKSQDGTIYVYTKNGFNNAPAIMKLDQVYNRNNKEYGEIMGIGGGSGFYLQK